jgi:hypothetical protein
MTIYFMEKKPDGTISLYDCKMKDRATLWVNRPYAKSITKKEYDALIEFLNSDEYRQLLTKTNK